MKKLTILKVILLAITITFISCSSDDGGSKPQAPTITSISITTDGLLDIITGTSSKFVVKDQAGNDVSSQAKIFVDDVAINSSSYTFDEEKSYSVYATVNDIKSSTITIKSIEPTHTTKVLLEDYTGTWCGFCPRLASKIDEITESNKDVIAVALHNDNDFLFPGISVLESAFNVTGYPSGRINRTLVWSETSIEVTTHLSNKKNLGLAISSSINENKITATVKVHYDVKSDGVNKLVVYLLENNLLADQVNYYNDDENSPWYQKGNPIKNFTHNHTARAALTNALGDIIPDSDVQTGNTYTANLTLNLPSSIKDKNNLELVAFVVSDDNSVINAQKAVLGETKDFD